MMLRLLILASLLAIAPHAYAQVSPDDARNTLEVLQDPQKRDQLISTLKTIAQAQPKPTPAQTAAQIAPGSLGAEVLVGASGFLNHLSGEARATLGAIQSVPLLWAWLHIMATEPWAHDILLDTAWRLVVVLALSLAVGWAMRRAVERPILVLVRRAPNGSAPIHEEAEARAEHGETEPPHRRRLAALTLLRRMPLMLGRFALELLPVLAFLAAGHLLAATSLGGRDPPRLVLLAVIDAYALCAAILCVARVMFSPRQPRLRMLTMTDSTAAYAMRWTSRIAAVSVFGYAAAEVGSLLGLSDTAHDALLKAVAFVVNVFLAIIVLQQRKTVRRMLRAPEGTSRPVAALRNWLARIWHWLALMLLAGLWLASVIEVQHGYANMLRYLGSIVVVMILARLLQIVVLGASRPRDVTAAGHGVALSGHRGAPRTLSSGDGRHRARPDPSHRRDRAAPTLGAWRVRLADGQRGWPPPAVQPA